MAATVTVTVTQPRVWRYTLPYNQKSDGGTFLLDADGMFSGTSAYGGYAYRWRAFQHDFRAFFASCDASYLYDRLRRPRREMMEIVDDEKTRRAIRKVAWERYGASEEFDHEVEVLEAWGDLGERGAWDGWERETKLEEPWFLMETVDTDFECKAFCELLIPRLQARLRFDLARGVP